jgi:hypothetical protein
VSLVVPFLRLCGPGHRKFGKRDAYAPRARTLHDDGRLEKREPMPPRKTQPASRKPKSTARTTRESTQTSRAAATSPKSGAAPLVHVVDEVTEPTQIEITIVLEIRPAAGSGRADAGGSEAAREQRRVERGQPGGEDPRPGG